MKKIIFTCKFFTLRVRDALLIVAAMLLLFSVYLYAARKENESTPIAKQQQKEEHRPETEKNIEEEITRPVDTTVVIEQKKKKKIINVCSFTRFNINDIEYLLSRADLCSEPWLDDLDVLIEGIQEQNQMIKDKEEKEYKELYAVQKKLYDSLVDFRKVQDVEEIDALEKALMEYKAHYDKTCSEKKGGAQR